MSLSLPLLFGLVLGGFIAFFVTYSVIKWRLLDHPNDRSLHTISTPKAGGLGVMAGVMVPLVLTALTDGFGVYAMQVLALVVLGIMTGLLGLYDDLRDLNAKLKFLILAVLAFAAAGFIATVETFALDQGHLALPFIIALTGTALWVFVLSNAVNFMDGSDGLIAASGAVAAAALAILALSNGNDVAALMALALMTALAGFLVLNIPPARIFLGDTGALFIGFWLAGAALLYIADGPPGAVYAAVLIFMPWLSDILLTMAWRAYKRMDLLEAHNDHIYQLALRQGASHGKVAMALALQTALCGALAWVFRTSATSELLALISVACFAIIVHWWLRTVFTANQASGDNASAPKH